MKKMYMLLLFFIAFIGYGQNYTVTTILDSPVADVDDALALDSQGNLYGSNFAGTTVYKISPSGAVSSFATGLINPNGLAFDSQDNLYVVEYGGGAIHKYDINGNLLETFAVGGFPSGLVKADKSDHMIFTTADFGDLGGNGVFMLNTTDGSVATIYQGAPLVLPVGLTYGPGGRLYIGDYLSREIYRHTTKRGLEYVATVPAPDNFVPFLAFITYAQGFLYGTVYGENKIYKVNPRKIDDVELFSGSTFGAMDGHISVATYAFPGGILANKSGNTIYVSEFSGIGNIRKITRGGGANKSYENATAIAFPNPASDVLTIGIPHAEGLSYRIEVYDIFANKVYETIGISAVKNFQKTISLAQWNSGLYEVIISYGDHKQFKKIIVN